MIKRLSFIYNGNSCTGKMAIYIDTDPWWPVQVVVTVKGIKWCNKSRTTHNKTLFSYDSTNKSLSLSNWKWGHFIQQYGLKNGQNIYFYIYSYLNNFVGLPNSQEQTGSQTIIKSIDDLLFLPLFFSPQMTVILTSMSLNCISFGDWVPVDWQVPNLQISYSNWLNSLRPSDAYMRQ